MAAFFDSILPKQQAFIEAQHLFFVGTAAEKGEVNLSPKGMEALKVLTPNKLLWLNYTGSGNETAAHVQRINRMTIMWCSFDKAPLILRVYATVNTIHINDPRWDTLISHFPVHEGARQLFELNVHQVQTSCGFAVPYYEYQGERPTLQKHWEQKGDIDMPDYWAKKNATSIDNFDTGITAIARELESK
jgi:hypothetical protein